MRVTAGRALLTVVHERGKAHAWKGPKRGYPLFTVWAVAKRLAPSAARPPKSTSNQTCAFGKS